MYGGRYPGLRPKSKTAKGFKIAHLQNSRYSFENGHREAFSVLRTPRLTSVFQFVFEQLEFLPSHFALLPPSWLLQTPVQTSESLTLKTFMS